MKCHHCGKAYKSKAGLVYHLRAKHGPVSADCHGYQDSVVVLQPFRLETRVGFNLLLGWVIRDSKSLRFSLSQEDSVLDTFLLAAAVAVL